MSIVAIIQARMGSTRLPGKVLMGIGGMSMLARVVRRTRRSRLIDDVVVATTEGPEDQAVVEECQRLNVHCLRGSRDDVLDRYHMAALAFSADGIVRITSDCPLIDPGVIDRVVQVYLENGPDYASNTLVRSFPQGLDTEAFTIEALEKAWGEAREPYQRSHVTPYIYQNPGLFKLLPVVGDEDYSHLRWTVDTAEDINLIREIYHRLEWDSFSWKDVLALIADEPELVDINRHIRQKPLREG